jgi:hypothetical protein
MMDSKYNASKLTRRIESGTVVDTTTPNSIIPVNFPKCRSVKGFGIPLAAVANGAPVVRRVHWPVPGCLELSKTASVSGWVPQAEAVA